MREKREWTSLNVVSDVLHLMISLGGRKGWLGTGL